MKLYIIVAGWIYACKEPWNQLRELHHISNATTVAFVENPALQRMWLDTIRPDLTILMTQQSVHAQIHRLIPWINDKGTNMHFLKAERCCHAPYILYRRYEAMSRLLQLHVSTNDDAQVVVLRPDSTFDPKVVMTELQKRFNEVTHASSFSSARGGHKCPQSVNDQWLMGRFQDIEKLLMAFPRLAEWHRVWERDPRYVEWWLANNRVPDGKFFLNTEGIVGKMLQQCNLTCRTTNAVDVRLLKTC
jgi:hypothetical protein